MVAVRRVVEEEIPEEHLGTFLMEQARSLPIHGCFVGGDQTAPIRRGDILFLRDEEYGRQGVYPGSPIYVMSTVPEAGVIWAIYVREQDKAVGGSFFNGTQLIIKKPERAAVRLATER